MSASQTQPTMTVSAYGNQCMDSTDLEAFLDFNQMASPAIDKGKGRMIQAPSTLTSPSTSVQYFDMADEQHTPMQPSHDYSQYKQQIGIPTQTQSSVFTAYNSGIYEPQVWEGGNIMGSSDLDSFLNISQGEDLIDPSFILKQEEAQAPIRYYPGMHQQQAELAKQMMLKQKQREVEQQQRAEASRRSASQQPIDQMRDETISRVMSEMRRNSSITSEALSPSAVSVLPHIVRAKKDEDDMDEDERLLNSEEGKKLSSKERRQLRNKVSARAFRSRRKEYITQLEGQLAAKSNEVATLKRENHALMAENARFHDLAEKLLSHPAFMPYLDELSRDPALADSLAKISGNSQAASSQSQMPKDADPYSASQQFVPSNNETIVGMTLIPEVPVDLSSLNLGSNHWPLPQSNMGMNTFQSPQVFAVTEVSQPAEPLDISALSGKESEAVLARYMDSEEEKISYPEIVIPQKTEVAQINEPEEEFDENDPNETLFANSSKPACRENQPSEVQDDESIFGSLSMEKVFARYEFVVTSELDDQLFTADLELKFARLEASFRRLESLTSRF